MEQEHRITYKAGITRTPSDFLCADGELAECINLATDSEELKPMVQPQQFISDTYGMTIVYVHRYADEVTYIGHWYSESAGKEVLVAGAEGTGGGMNHNLIDPDSPPFEWLAGAKVTSIGLTVLVSDSNGVHYFKWKSHMRYKSVGNVIPDPKFEFWIKKKAQMNLSGTTLELDPERYADNTGDSSETLLERGDETTPGSQVPERYPYIQKGHVEDYNDLVIGLYSKNLKSIAQKKRFAQPFAVRTALRLYDGRYTHISQPVMLFPSVTGNTFGVYMTECNSLKLVTDFGDLQFTQTEASLEDWDDIVSEVVIFISRGVSCYDTGIDQGADKMDLVYKIHLDGIFREGSSSSSTFHGLEVSSKNFATYDYWQSADGEEHTTIITKSYLVTPLKERPKDEILQELKGTSLFYKMAEIGLKAVNSAKSISEYIDTHTLENLITQDRLMEDDWYSRCALDGDTLYTYNSRLNLANVRRGVFEGFDNFLPFDGSEAEYDFRVRIKTDTGGVVVRHVVRTKQKQGIYFFYPDPRAKWVTIYKGSGMNRSCVCNAELTEHPALNGAYYFKGLPGTGTGYNDETTVTEPSTSSQGIPYNEGYNNNYKEELPNYIVTSEVNNPWVFRAEGYNKVGIGKILGISTMSMALSQDAYGRTDLVVFSERGIWGMAVDDTGLYQSIHPYFRDVCINPASITQVDGAVFFVSKKGLMLLTDGGVKCVSERMNGATFDTATLISFSSDGEQPTADPADEWKGIIKACQGARSFLDFMRGAGLFMAYDYIDSRIVMCNPEFGFSYVYNMADGTISKAVLPAAMTNAVADYPDYLLQGNVTETVVVDGNPTSVVKSKVYSFYRKPREEEVNARQTGFVLTRPMKLAGPVSQSSLRQLMNVGTWNKGTGNSPLSCVKTDIWLSEDMVNWYQGASRFGAAARYFRLALYLRMLPTERLSGTILTDQERRSNNMR